MHFKPTNSEVYYGISKGYHEMFHDALKEIQLLIGDKPSYDVLSHSQEDNNRFFYFEQIQRQAMMICIVFQAFAIEAYVNLIAVNLYEENEFFGKFEEMGTLKKINKIFSEKLKSDFKKDKDIYNLVDITFDLRDKLAHFKSKKIDLHAMQEDPDIYNPYEFYTDFYEKIDNIVNTYPKFKVLVDGLVGHDVIDKQMNDIEEMLKFNIQEIIRKTFK